MVQKVNRFIIYVILNLDLHLFKKIRNSFNFNLILLMLKKNILFYILILSLLNFTNCWEWSSIFGGSSKTNDK